MGADEAVICDASVLGAMVYGDPQSAEAPLSLARDDFLRRPY